MTKAAVRASRKYLYYAIGGAAFAFIGLIFVLNYSTTGNTEFVPGGIMDAAAAADNGGGCCYLSMCWHSSDLA